MGLSRGARVLPHGQDRSKICGALLGWSHHEFSVSFSDIVLMISWTATDYKKYKSSAGNYVYKMYPTQTQLDTQRTRQFFSFAMQR